jgi:hypothetical protein
VSISLYKSCYTPSSMEADPVTHVIGNPCQLNEARKWKDMHLINPICPSAHYGR